jgi:hypothetical protein
VTAIVIFCISLYSHRDLTGKLKPSFQYLCGRDIEDLIIPSQTVLYMLLMRAHRRRDGDELLCGSLRAIFGGRSLSGFYQKIIRSAGQTSASQGHVHPGDSVVSFC